MGADHNSSTEIKENKKIQKIHKSAISIHFIVFDLVVENPIDSLYKKYTKNRKKNTKTQYKKDTSIFRCFFQNTSLKLRFY